MAIQRSTESIEQRKKLGSIILSDLSDKPGPVKPQDLIEQYAAPGKPESAVLDAIWYLLDRHLVKLNNQLQLVAIRVDRS